MGVDRGGVSLWNEFGNQGNLQGRIQGGKGSTYPPDFEGKLSSPRTLKEGKKKGKEKRRKREKYERKGEKREKSKNCLKFLPYLDNSIIFFWGGGQIKPILPPPHIPVPPIIFLNTHLETNAGISGNYTFFIEHSARQALHFSVAVYFLIIIQKRS